MDLNRNFGKIESDGKSITFAPTCLWPSLKPATADELKEAGWLEIRVSKPSPPEGYMLTDTSYEARYGAIYGVYTYAPIPAPVRNFSKYKIECNISDAQSVALEQMLRSAGKYRFWDRATVLREDDPNFIAACQGIVATGICTADELTAILNASVEGAE